MADPGNEINIYIYYIVIQYICSYTDPCLIGTRSGKMSYHRYLQDRRQEAAVLSILIDLSVQMTLVRVSGSPPLREVRMTTWQGEQSGTDSWLQSQPKNPASIFLCQNSLTQSPVNVTFLRICQLFPPVCPVPRDLTETPVDPEPDGDGNDPYGIEQEDAGRHKYLKHVFPVNIGLTGECDHLQCGNRISAHCNR